uniref:ARAD1B09878p n=1 Tax=Blastobotrys adeninivorans TaxID=409370 RepID=A0A060T694_BLAAD
MNPINENYVGINCLNLFFIMFRAASRQARVSAGRLYSTASPSSTNSSKKDLVTFAVVLVGAVGAGSVLAKSKSKPKESHSSEHLIPASEEEIRRQYERDVAERLLEMKNRPASAARSAISLNEDVSKLMLKRSLKHSKDREYYPDRRLQEMDLSGLGERDAN